MSETKKTPISYKPLLTGLTAWVCFFIIFAGTGKVFTDFDQQLGTFLSAMMLTVVSILFVYGFSRLNLERTIYLLVGVIAIGAIYFSASPLVKRSSMINSSGEIPGQIVFLTFRSVFIQPKADELIMPVRNSFFKEITGFVEDNTPEPAWLIVILAIAQLTLASGVGLWIAKGIDDITHLIPVALVATIADIWSVSAGATAKIIVSPSINYFLLRFPMFGSESIPYLIGLTDFLFFAIFFQAAIRYNLGALKNAVLLAASFFIAIISAIYSSTGLPVLPFMAVLFVAGNFSKLELKKEELKQVLIFVLVIIVIFALISAKIR